MELKTKGFEKADYLLKHVMYERKIVFQKVMIEANIEQGSVGLSWLSFQSVSMSLLPPLLNPCSVDVIKWVILTVFVNPQVHDASMGAVKGPDLT